MHLSASELGDKLVFLGLREGQPLGAEGEGVIPIREAQAPFCDGCFRSEGLALWQPRPVAPSCGEEGGWDVCCGVWGVGCGMWGVECGVSGDLQRGLRQRVCVWEKETEAESERESEVSDV